MTCDYALDDGAYVLGALSPAERGEYERHLATCTECRGSVATLAVLPGLLARLDPQRAAALSRRAELPDRPAASPPPAILDGAVDLEGKGAPGGTDHVGRHRGDADRTRPVRDAIEPAPSTLLNRVLTTAAQQRRTDQRRGRRNRFVLVAVLGLATAMLVTAVGVGVHIQDLNALPPTPSPSASIQMTAMRPASQTWTPVSADVGLVPTQDGTQVVLTCWYGNWHQTAGSQPPWTLKLVVFDTGGKGEPLGSWTADDGDKVTMNELTHLSVAQIDRIEIQQLDNTPLLWWTPS
jgi:anti-sigma factor RsiW